MTYLIVQLTHNEVLWGRFQRRRGELTFMGGGRHALDGGPTFADLLKELAETRREDERVVLSLPPFHISFSGNSTSPSPTGARPGRSSPWNSREKRPSTPTSWYSMPSPWRTAGPWLSGADARRLPT